MKTLIKGFITYRPNPYGDKKGRIGFEQFDPRSLPEIYKDTVVVREHQFEVDTPDNFDPRPDQIKALRAIEKKARADFEVRINEIKQQISRLEAIEYTP